MATDRFLHKLLDDDKIKYGFFTRNGGYSLNPFDSLNCSLGVNDEIDDVNKNINLVCRELYLKKIIKLNQTHSAKVHIVVNKKNDELIEGDGLVTNLKGIGLSILGADCAPILFYDKVSCTIGACHAGWRGALNNIIESTVSSMETIGAKRKNIISIIGPTIQKRSYEIKEDVAGIIKKNPFYLKNYSILSLVSKGKYLFDLPLLIKESLKYARIEQIGNINVDTYENSNLFFSHRRTTHHQSLTKTLKTGRQISVIGILK